MPSAADIEEKTRAVIELLSDRFKRERASLIPILQHVQGEVGFLPERAVMGIAKFCRVPASTVYGVATFYAQFRFKPIGRNVITVCRGTACHVRGSRNLVDELREVLGIGPGETTADMEFTLLTVACFGSCALAPVVLVNGKVHGWQTPKSVRKLIENLRSPVGAEEAS